MAGRRKVWKVLGVIVASIVGLFIVAVVGVVVVSARKLSAKVTVPVPVASITIPKGDPAAIMRGQYLVDHVLACKVCHAADFGGRAEIDDAMVGTLWGPNLTSGRGSAVTAYTPVDWVRSIRHGVGTDGRRLLLMPSEDFYSFGDADLGAIVVYVKSMPPVDRDNRGIELGPLGRFLVASETVSFAFDKIDHGKPRSGAPPAATREWGAVLAGACLGCHGAGYSGGLVPGTPPEWPPARNLTPHETGMKGWTLAQFSAALRTGVRPDGSPISPVMPWKAFAGMSDSDVEALYLYLMSLPPKPAGNR